MNEDRLAQIIRATADDLQAAFKRTAAIQHQAQKGAAREDPVLAFVRSRLPGAVVATGSGEVIDAAGGCSQQQDILIVDPSTPPFLDEERHRVYPVEAVHGVIEVKSSLSKKTLLEACDAIASVKRLKKTSYHPDLLGRTFTGLTGTPMTHRPTFGYVFAYGGNTKIETLASNFCDWCERHPPEEWPDGLYVLGKGSIVWFRDGVPFETLVSAACVGFIESQYHRDVFVTMALHLQMAFATAWMPPLKLHDYLRGTVLGVAKWTTPAAPSWPPSE